jgi:hypothetical protein
MIRIIASPLGAEGPAININTGSTRIDSVFARKPPAEWRGGFLEEDTPAWDYFVDTDETFGNEDVAIIVQRDPVIFDA